MPTLVVDSPRLSIEPWPDPVIDALGHDPRSGYVELYWLGILGPSTTWLMRRLASNLEREPGGFELDLEDTACRLGLGHRGGRNSPFMRTLSRCVDFDLAQPRAGGALAVRRRMPPLTRRQLTRLPESLQRSHQRWQDAQVHHPGGADLKSRVLSLAARRPRP